MSWMFESHNAWFEIEFKWDTDTKRAHTTNNKEKSIELHPIYRKQPTITCGPMLKWEL
jgi:hypothetical protein